MRVKVIALLSAAVFSFASVPVQARVGGMSGFWSTLDRNGVLSAGWVDVLPVLASACGLELDSRELNSVLVDLSHDQGNANYTWALYSHLRQIERGRSSNDFFGRWDAMFHGKPKDSCRTAEALWGGSGQQFPGVLKRVASANPATPVPNRKGCR